METEKCPICHDCGMVTLDVPTDHPDFGKSFPCTCMLRELDKGRIERLERYSNLGPLTRLTFENLEPKGLDGDPQRQAKFQSCYEKARVFADHPKGWLVLTGPSGCGKTHTAAAITNHCLSQGIASFWAIVPDLLDHLRTTFSPASDITYDDLFERVKNAPLLILDDLGTHSSTPWAEEKLFQVLNSRFNSQLPTVVTSISVDDLDERLQTRLRSPGLSIELILKTDSPLVHSQIIGMTKEAICSMSFRDFDPQGMNADRKQRASLKIALDAAQQFAEQPEAWLVLVGPAGSGKTHLAAAVANRQIMSNRPVFFASVQELLDQLRPNSDGKRSKQINLDIIKTCPLLIFDDLGMETATAWARDKVYQILNYRYNAKLATLITATDPDMETLDIRLKSRLEDPKISNVVPIGAPNYRGGDILVSGTKKTKKRQ
ncbi:ATP-binding protein [Chloroflexota bacterium]